MKQHLQQFLYFGLFLRDVFMCTFFKPKLLACLFYSVELHLWTHGKIWRVFFFVHKEAILPATLILLLLSTSKRGTIRIYQKNATTSEFKHCFLNEPWCLCICCSGLCFMLLSWTAAHVRSMYRQRQKHVTYSPDVLIHFSGLSICTFWIESDLCFWAQQTQRSTLERFLLPKFYIIFPLVWCKHQQDPLSSAQHTWFYH